MPEHDAVIIGAMIGTPIASTASMPATNEFTEFDLAWFRHPVKEGSR